MDSVLQSRCSFVKEKANIEYVSVSRLKLPEERVRGFRHLVSYLRRLLCPSEAQDGPRAASRVSVECHQDVTFLI